MIKVNLGHNGKDYYVRTNNPKVAEATAIKQWEKDGGVWRYGEARMADIKVLSPYRGMDH